MHLQTAGTRTGAGAAAAECRLHGCHRRCKSVMKLRGRAEGLRERGAAIGVRLEACKRQKTGA